MIRITAVFVAGTAAFALSAACGDEGGRTRGARVALEGSVLAPTDELTFTNDKGWRVAIARARMGLGTISFHEGAPIASRGERAPDPRSRRNASARGSLAFFVGTAHAHPGHYVEGDALGQFVGWTGVDLVAGAALPRGEGVTGSYRSARLAFGDVDGRNPEGNPDAIVAVVEGAATRAEEQRAFRVEVRASDLATGGALVVEGCPVEDGEIQRSRAIELTVRPSVWFERADFAELAPAGNEPRAVPRETVFFRAVVRGMRAATSYRFSTKGSLGPNASGGSGN
jgi:hypothetical protein